MKRYQKQLLVYSLLVLMFFAFLYSGYQIHNDNQISQANEPGLSYPRPQASLTAIMLQGLGISDFKPGLFQLLIILFFASSPLWIFSGYYFARKLNIPGIYNEGMPLKKELFFVTAVCLVWGLIIPVIQYFIDLNMISYSDISTDAVLIVTSIRIFTELLLRLFILSFIS